MSSQLFMRLNYMECASRPISTTRCGASSTNGCYMLICSLRRGKENSAICGYESFGPIGHICEICKKSGAWQNHALQILLPSSSRTIVRSWACALFMADKVEISLFVGGVGRFTVTLAK